MIRTDYTRDELIEICERAIVPEERWANRDTPDSQEKVGRAWAALKAGCSFMVTPPGPNGDSSGCQTDENTIWIEIVTKTFNSFEYGGGHLDSDTYYLPTPKRLDERAGRDWY